MIKKTSLLFGLITLLLALGPVDAASYDFTTRQYRGQKYIPLSQIQEYYQFRSLTQSGRKIALKKPGVSVLFSPGGQEVLMNQVKFIFSHPVVNIGGHYHLSLTDLIKVVDPVLEPHKIKNIKAFDTIIIDPGHGGKDSGGLSRYGKESFYNLQVARVLKAYLTNKGFKVVLTRDSDTFLSLSERVAFANRYANAIFISIHFNSSGTGNRDARGIETFTLSPKGVPHYGKSLKSSDLINRRGNIQDAANIALATSVHWWSIKNLSEAGMTIPDRGIRRARFSVLSDIKHPAILLEGGFLSHPVESRLIHTKTYQMALAKAVGDAIVFYRQKTLR